MGKKFVVNGIMTTLTVEELKDNCASPKDVKEEKLNAVLVRLVNDWITTSDKLKDVRREDLLEKDYPLGFVNAVKPQEGMARFASVSIALVLNFRFGLWGAVQLFFLLTLHLPLSWFSLTINLSGIYPQQPDHT